MGNRRPPSLWLPSKTPPVVLGPAFSESPGEKCRYRCLQFAGIVCHQRIKENLWALKYEISDSTAFITE